MKMFPRAALVILLITTARVGLCQATFLFRNFLLPGGDAPVFDADGIRLAGTNYLAVLYGGPSPDSLELAGVSSFADMQPVPFTVVFNGQQGYFEYRNSYVVIENVPGGGPAWLQVRAWDLRMGGTYDDAVARGLGGYGASTLFQQLGGDPTLGVPTPPEPFTGLQSFSLRPVVPEPAYGLLLLLGLPVVFFIRRFRCPPRAGGPPSRIHHPCP